MSVMKEKIEKLRALKAEARLGGGAERIEAQHKKGKLTARERVDLLMDEGTFQEIDMLVRHRSKDFGLESQRILGDGVIIFFVSNRIGDAVVDSSDTILESMVNEGIVLNEIRIRIQIVLNG